MADKACERCGEGCHRDEVDIGVGTIYGPYGCPSCGWSDWPEYDRSGGPSPKQREAGGEWYVDQWGGMRRVSSIADHCERFGIPRSVVDDAFREDLP